MSSIPLAHLLKIGGDALQTTAQTLSGAVNELKTSITGKSTVSIATTGTASSSDVRKQEVTVDGTAATVDGTVYMEQSVTLSTSDSTIVTFTNAIITANSVIDVYCSAWDTVPENVSCAAGTCAVTMPKVDTAVTVTVRIYVR